MQPYRETTSEESGLFETCARHKARFTARTLQTIYLCDPCTRRIVKKAFNNRAPVFHGQTIEGYCGLCNHRRSVTMRQWFVCGICWNVVVAYQKSVAASQAVHRWWARAVQPSISRLNLVETEAVYLSPFAPTGVPKFKAAQELTELDFLVSDMSHRDPVPLFHIEQKTGPTAIDQMREFQLDVNDFNDIAGAVNKTGLPAYVIHVQACKDYTFPTSRTVVRYMWWTDAWTLRAHQKRVAARRGEDKRAIYYEPNAFRPIEDFAREVKEKAYERLARKVRKVPLRPIK